jgi:hypothetical protein
MVTSPFRVLFAIAAVLAAGCDIKVDDGRVSLGVSRGRASDEWSRTYTLSKGGRFELVNENGLIEVRGTSGAQVVVKATREVSDSNDQQARARLQNLKMREEVAPDRVLVQAETGDSGSFGMSRGVNIRYDVEVPAGLALVLRTQNGPLRIRNVDGRVTAATTNGTVSGEDVSGSIEASTVNGGVIMDMAAVRGEVRLTTVNGGVRLQLPKTVDADLQATTVNGRVSVDEQLGVANVSGDHPGFGRPTSFSGRLNKGGARVSLQTTNGGVRVAPRGPAGEP